MDSPDIAMRVPARGPQDGDTMRIITPVIYAGLLGVSIYAALAQTSPIQYTPPAAEAQAPTKLAYATPDDGTQKAAKSATRLSKREVCRQKISAKHLKHREARDKMQLCVAEARVECLKQAIDRHVHHSQRRLFVRSCVAS
jgi:anti-sigma28 factor (negative regulator of flagellin synthesis)